MLELIILKEERVPSTTQIPVFTFHVGPFHKVVCFYLGGHTSEKLSCFISRQDVPSDDTGLTTTGKVLSIQPWITVTLS